MLKILEDTNKEELWAEAETQRQLPLVSAVLWSWLPGHPKASESTEAGHLCSAWGSTNDNMATAASSPSNFLSDPSSLTSQKIHVRYDCDWTSFFGTEFH